LLLYRELDDALGLTDLAGQVLSDMRRGKNTHNGAHPLAHQFMINEKFSAGAVIIAWDWGHRVRISEYPGMNELIEIAARIGDEAAKETVERIAALGDDPAFRYLAKATEDRLKDRGHDDAKALLGQVAQGDGSPADILDRIGAFHLSAGDLAAGLGYSFRAATRHLDAGNDAAVTGIFERLASLVDDGTYVSYPRILDFLFLDDGNQGRWVDLVSKLIAAEVRKISARNSDARSLYFLDDLIEEVVTTNTDPEAAAAWARRNGKASIAAKVRGEGAPGGISHEFDGKGLDDLCQVYGDVESATFTATPTGIHRKIVLRKTNDFDLFHRNFLDSEGWPIPNTDIWRAGGGLLVELNSLGCIGPEVNGPVVAFFGASETFGAAGARASYDTADVASNWPQRVSVAGAQMLNAAVLGYSMERILARYEFIRDRRVDMVGVVVYAGWHNLIYNANTEAYWGETLEKFLADDRPSAFCNICTALIPEARERGLGEIICGGGFTFWNDLEATPDNIARMLDRIDDYNRFVEGFCQRHGATLIDLYSLMKPQRYEDIPVEFSDINHFRVSAFDKIARAVGNAIRDPITANMRDRAVVVSAPNIAAPDTPAQPSGGNGRDPSDYLYPLW
jgi:hypothetical protein